MKRLSKVEEGSGVVVLACGCFNIDPLSASREPCPSQKRGQRALSLSGTNVVQVPLNAPLLGRIQKSAELGKVEPVKLSLFLAHQLGLAGLS
jgi:hypothetical protein